MFVYFYIVIFSLIFGSFLNVCIYRIPRGESLVSPGSHCPRCGHNIRWYENIPVLSYVFLLGKCSKCRKKISAVYPIVEILTAVVAVSLYARFGGAPKSVIYFALFSALIVVSFIDFERLEIPDIISLPGIVIGLGVSVIYPELLSKGRFEAFIDSLLGVLIGGGSLYLLGFLGEIVFKKEAMGGGDVKLLAMIGAFLGWQGALLTFFIAPFLGILAAVKAKIIQKKGVIPYGPYISLAAFITALWGRNLIDWYWGMLLF